MAKWSEMPEGEDMGYGIVRMDIAPIEGCFQCGEGSWDLAMVNTSTRFDLLSNKTLKTWTARSECAKCGSTHIWIVAPDEPYLKT